MDGWAVGRFGPGPDVITLTSLTYVRTFEPTVALVKEFLHTNSGADLGVDLGANSEASWQVETGWPYYFLRGRGRSHMGIPEVS